MRVPRRPRIIPIASLVPPGLLRRPFHLSSVCSYTSRHSITKFFSLLGKLLAASESSLLVRAPSRLLQVGSNFQLSATYRHGTVALCAWASGTDERDGWTDSFVLSNLGLPSIHTYSWSWLHARTTAFPPRCFNLDTVLWSDTHSSRSTVLIADPPIFYRILASEVLLGQDSPVVDPLQSSTQISALLDGDHATAVYRMRNERWLCPTISRLHADWVVLYARSVSGS
ncbi:uncharacterized protein B0H18DRAFT_141375 [Fomitopsis serialis]|uniref:uncharacterized protein n=1 Tax=Fomitopsis serialis TaxID=139415 RepID=UPI002007D73B|nr:uncharacterized protein B0H18DRAFT_141375 [Neoantrodia serialis]KAH9914132.1 hypothetical protein B0H18DRAFT_141375 [Neoantrodia serialis]